MARGRTATISGIRERLARLEKSYERAVETVETVPGEIERLQAQLRRLTRDPAARAKAAESVRKQMERLQREAELLARADNGFPSDDSSDD